MHGVKFLTTILILATLASHAAEPMDADVVVYGGTPAGVMSAIAAARHGQSVALIDLNAHVGGVVSGGLVSSDMGDRQTIGGLAKEFFTRVGGHYPGTDGADSAQPPAGQGGAGSRAPGGGGV